MAIGPASWSGLYTGTPPSRLAVALLRSSGCPRESCTGQRPASAAISRMIVLTDGQTQGGNYQQLMESIREQVLTLTDDTRLYSGHGPATTVCRRCWA